MSQKRKRSPEASPLTDVFRSAPIEDRSSTFTGYFSPSSKPKDLQKLEEYADASHKILAWRRESNQQAITGKTNYVVGHDDDGEKYAGKRVEKVLESMQVTGSCVVARWYGGVLLGPVRFTHIEECAKGAVRKWQEHHGQEALKKQKVKDDENDRARLVGVLAERDESIVVLRKLAAAKESELNEIKSGAEKSKDGVPDDEPTSLSAPSALPSTPSMNYESFPVERLRTLEKARDATLTFLLKRIDKAEIELGTLELAKNLDAT